MEKKEKIIKKKRTMELHGLSFSCELAYYLAPDGTLYESGDLVDQNLLAVQDAYRKQAGLLTSAEIKEIRSAYHLSQKDFALILGLGEVSVTRFETKMSQSETIDDALRRAESDPAWFLAKFDGYAKQMEIEKAAEVRSAILGAVESRRNIQSLVHSLINCYYARFEKPSSQNGYCSLNLPAIIGIAKLCEERKVALTETKFAKLLFYSDFASYREKGKGITGLVYRHLAYGACPLALNFFLELPVFRVKESPYQAPNGEEWMVNFIQTTLRGRLSAEQRSIVTLVLDHFEGKNTSDIVEEMHQEKAFKATESGAIIDYAYAQDLLWPK